MYGHSWEISALPGFSSSIWRTLFFLWAPGSVVTIYMNMDHVIWKNIRVFLSPRIVPSTVKCFYSERHQELGLTEGTEDWLFPIFCSIQGFSFWEQRLLVSSSTFKFIYSFSIYIYVSSYTISLTGCSCLNMCWMDEELILLSRIQLA